MSALLFQEEQCAVKEYGIKPRTYKCTMVFTKKTSCPERKGGTCSQAREAFLAFWTRKESSCLNHLPQRTVIKAFTDPELPGSQTGLGKVISNKASAVDEASGGKHHSALTSPVLLGNCKTRAIRCVPHCTGTAQ